MGLTQPPQMIENAGPCTPDNVHCVLADVLTDPLPGKDYDAIVSISALHHLPLPDAPGARVRRLLFWRYLLVWHKPNTPPNS